MTLEEFNAESRHYAAVCLRLIIEFITDAEAKKIEPELKRKLIATGLSLVLYLQEDLEKLRNGSENSIS